MQVHVTKTKFRNAVSLAERLTGKKESLPVLSCLILEATSKTLVLRATNLEAGIEISVPARVERSGIRAAPAAVLRETVRAVSGESITLMGADGNLSIESRGSKNLIKCVSHDEFPGLSKVGKKGGFHILRERFLSALEAVIYAASPSMIRPEL